MKKISILIFTILLSLYSCGGSKKTVSSTSKSDTKTSTVTKSEKRISKGVKAEDANLDFNTLRYIAKYKNIAKKEMKEYGVPASITLAQGILESNSGKSRLALEGQNHFGIKCHQGWKGQTILHDDNKNQECFRKYLNPEESFKDHSRFLAERKRYAFLFRLPITDYEAWAKGLKKAGYATDPSYPDKLIYIIDKYDLSKFDKEVLENMSVKVQNDTKNKQNKKKKFIYEVKDGETLFTISRKFNIPVKDIQRINNLNDFDIYQGQILVLTESDAVENVAEANKELEKEMAVKEEEVEIISNQNEKANKKPKTPKQSNQNLKLHTVKQGETLFSLSKEFNIKVEDLKEANNLQANVINVGDVIKIPMHKVQKEKIENNEVVNSKPKKGNKKENSKPENSDTEAVYHIVKPGETLYRIHVNYKVSIKKLRKLNNLKGNNIKVGQKIRVK